MTPGISFRTLFLQLSYLRVEVSFRSFIRCTIPVTAAAKHARFPRKSPPSVHTESKRFGEAVMRTLPDNKFQNGKAKFSI